jgi:hypothetical protein
LISAQISRKNYAKLRKSEPPTLRETGAKRSSAKPTAAKFGEANAESVISFCLNFFIQPRNDGSRT